MSPDAEHDAALYGHGVSAHEDGHYVHIAAGPWSTRYWTGNPDSLWAEERADYWIASVWGRCGRGLTWKSGPSSATTPRSCPTCVLSDAAISARHTRIR
ncbi:hypothetical protein OG883_44060 [Streptomyces sp. NBC_01142]|uniref:hypothetical protein n=1 Tax=Streptomyces sp. NBC_01142 TaxID=2975865 RepID=UPI0022580A08|nr:hypothetical protein [Streptomyces sp. NBC_01142]MCX4826618.1 hypothetical protein [Streptomyces sp. NBC_01142]